MKGLLVEKKIKPPKTHNLIEFQFLLQEHHAVALADDLEALSLWAVESRYPGVIPTWTQAYSVAESCRNLRTALLPFFET